MKWVRFVFITILFGALLSFGLGGCSSENMAPPPQAQKGAPVEKMPAPKTAEREAPGAEALDKAPDLGYPEAQEQADGVAGNEVAGVEAKRIDPPVAMSMEESAAKKSTKTKSRKFDLSKAEEEGFHRVQVYYGTNRNQTGLLEANDHYGKTRGAMTYGVCEVAIPLTHETGALEAPKWWKMEFSENPTKHVVLQKVMPLSWRGVAAQMNETLAQSSGRNAFVFVHGYNVSFKDAARRTAQIHHDLNFDGAPVFFSWPSRGEITLTSYTHDETNAKWSYSFLKDFLIKIATDTQADNIYLVAHSMGTRVLTNAVAMVMTERPDLKKRFKEIILAAPDIDADVFVNDLAPKLVEASRNTTLYASADDRALQTSREVHGGYARAGDAGENLIVLDGIDTIDATGVDASLLRHSYFAEAVNIIKDIKELVGLSKPASERTFLTLKKREKDGRQFFIVKK